MKFINNYINLKKIVEAEQYKLKLLNLLTVENARKC